MKKRRNKMTHKGSRIIQRLIGDFTQATKAFIELLRAFYRFRHHNNHTTVFGSSRLKQDHPTYQQAYQLGRLLAQNNIPIMTGGGPGIMEAISSGAQSKQGTTLGCIMNLPNETPCTEHSYTCQYFFNQKILLIKRAYACIIFPGGLGTIDELFELLTLIDTKRRNPIPILLVSTSFWKPLYHLIETMIEEKTINKNILNHITLVDSNSQVIQQLHESYDHENN